MDVWGDYSKFRVKDRLLLTGHSHQAWPDIAFDAQAQAFLDAAEHVDEKWGLALAKAERFRSLLKSFLGDPSGDYVLGQNTHELFLRFLSSLSLKKKLKILTTDGEFHSFRRQSQRLEELGAIVERVPVEPIESLAERMTASLKKNGPWDVIYTSHVFFETSQIFPGLKNLVTEASTAETPIVIDTYHSIGNRDFQVDRDGFEAAYLLGGGYKYLQLGEGNCFLRLPRGTKARPAITGWFAEFHNLSQSPEQQVGYPEGAEAFAGSTYDPTSHYRAVAVMEYFTAKGWTANRLQSMYNQQIHQMLGLLAKSKLPHELLSTTLPHLRAGFLTLITAQANAICASLKDRGVLSDFRGNNLRLGPAPYLSSGQIDTAMGHVIEVLETQKSWPKLLKSK